jgi:hypothetical protein
MPTNTVRQPFISFTAMRGIAPWLEKQDWARPYEIAPVPNQVFIWAMAETPLQTFAAVPVPDANKAVEELGRKLSARTNWQNCFTMPLTMKVTNNSIGWAGLPYVAPNLAAWRESSNDFLFASLFPNSPKREPLPPELFTLLGQTNLVYYHWEITAERLRLLPQLSQLALMATGHRQFDMQSAAGKWLDRVGPMLGNSVTRITWTAPNELTFLRIAPGGLNALELAALANWLEAPNFPGCDLRLPPRPQFKRPPHKTSETNSAPAPAIPKPPAMP